MKALWALENATVRQIRTQLQPERPLAYTTVMTVMARLLRKGAVEREKRGRAHLYRPAISEMTVREYELNQFVETFFRGSRDELLRYLEGVSQTELSEGNSAAARSPRLESADRDSPSGAKEAEIDASLL